MSYRINCRNCIHFNDLEDRCCLNDGKAIKKECYFILSNRKPKGKDVVIENLKTKIADLEAKLAKLNKEPLNCSQLEKGMSLCIIQKSDIAQLKQQLAEKEKEIDITKQLLENYRLQCHEFLKNETNICNQDKISFAIDKLVGIQKYISDNAVYIEEESFGREINDYIDNQIKQLKEGK